MCLFVKSYTDVVLSLYKGITIRFYFDKVHLNNRHPLYMNGNIMGIIIISTCL